jgi:hypothetical protein
MCAAPADSREFWFLEHAHRGRRSAESIEFRRARFFCFRNSKFDPKVQEKNFVGDSEDLKVFIESTIEDPSLADVPDAPRGLVLSDNHCTGAFQ